MLLLQLAMNFRYASYTVTLAYKILVIQNSK